MSPLIERLFAVLDALEAARIPHAVGGAIALAFCTKDPRGTRDLDLNIFLEVDHAEMVLKALPDEIPWGQREVRLIRETGQVRLRWEDTPVDLFFNNLPLHEEVARGQVTGQLKGREIPVLDATSLVIFKAMFNRTKDWADIEEILAHSRSAVSEATNRVAELIGNDDPITRRLTDLLDPPGV